MANTTHSVAYMGDAELIIMMRDGASDVAEVAFEALALRCEPAIRKRLKRLPPHPSRGLSAGVPALNPPQRLDVPR